MRWWWWWCIHSIHHISSFAIALLKINDNDSSAYGTVEQSPRQTTTISKRWELTSLEMSVGPSSILKWPTCVRILRSNDSYARKPNIASHRSIELRSEWVSPEAAVGNCVSHLWGRQAKEFNTRDWLWVTDSNPLTCPQYQILCRNAKPKGKDFERTICGVIGSKEGDETRVNKQEEQERFTLSSTATAASNNKAF